MPARSAGRRDGSEGVIRMGPWWPRLRTGIRDLNPGYFAPVMATGIISQAIRLEGAASLPGFLLSAGIVAYLLLVIAYGWRLAGYRREFLADAADPRRAFAFFTFTAASDVLSPGWPVTATPRRRCVLAPALAGANGT